MQAVLCSFAELFDSGVHKIVIPKLQRDYAQGRRGAAVDRVRVKFLDALFDAVTVKPIKLDFVYGDVDERGTLVPLDGQQRLTTLFLLHWYAAKHDGVSAERYDFLNRFGYETRLSARDFCEKLVAFTPIFDGGKLSEQIIDSEWFPLDHLSDPTVAAMLVMLDAIDEKFKTVDGLFQKLTGGAIKFYFLPMKDAGLSDELYIKMNSRGKPLTLFEHFKAELLHELKKTDEAAADRISGKFDKEWTDLLWKYRNVSDDRADNDDIDDAFLRYFRFICDMICYGDGYSDDENRTAFERSNDEFDLIAEYFGAGKPETANNIETLERYFDIWCDRSVGGSKELFGRFMSGAHEKDKIVIDGQLDLFEECIFGYADVSETSTEKRRIMQLGRAARLFAFVVYLDEKKNGSITDKEFSRRLRVINNLITNSQNEVADTPKSDNRNRMPKILKLIREIATGKPLSGLDNFRGFNPNQFDEEIEKQAWLVDHSDMAEALFALEDHPLLQGQMGVVGLDKPERFARFSSLFACDRDAVGRALLATGNYDQTGRNGKVQLGARNETSWRTLFHRSKNSDGFDSRTKPTLAALLDRSETFTDESLREIADGYLRECEAKRAFDWRYYFIKYDAFRPDRTGKYDFSGGDYAFVALWSSRLSERAFSPYLLAIGIGRVSNDDPHFIRLMLNGFAVTCEQKGFGIFPPDGSPKRSLAVPQNGDIDAVDRIALARERLSDLCR